MPKRVQKPPVTNNQQNRKFFRRKRDYNNANEINKIMKKLRMKCFMTPKDYHKMHVNRKDALKLIRIIIKHVDIKGLSLVRIIHLIWGYLACLYHFQSRLVLNHGMITEFRQQQFIETCNLYNDLLDYLGEQRKSMVLSSVLMFFKVGKLFESEEVCIFVLKKTIDYSGSLEESLIYILGLSQELTLTNIDEARSVISLLYEIMGIGRLSRLSNQIIGKLILMLRSSIDPGLDDDFYCEPLREGVTQCLRLCIKEFTPLRRLQLLEQFLKVVHEYQMSDEAIIAFSILAETASYQLMLGIQIFIPRSILKLIFTFIVSQSAIKCLMGLLVYQNIWDKHVNKPFLSTPIIFLDKENYRLTFSEESQRTRQHFNHRVKKYFTTCFLECLQTHMNNQSILENVFTCIALNICDLPSGIVASSAACLAMKIQEFARSDNQNMDLQYRYHLHALVASVLSLIGFIFHADALSGYINKVVSTRATFAPHLNPPLKFSYEMATHHILWPFSDFYFEDWELRYGLWKCFREHKDAVVRSKVLGVSVYQRPRLTHTSKSSLEAATSSFFL